MKKQNFIVLAIFAFLVSVNFAQAAAHIQVDGPVGSLFNVQNAAPGMEKTANITVLNDGDAPGDFPFTIHVTGSTKNLSEQLFFKIRFGANCIFGCNNEYPLSVINGVQQTINSIPADKVPYVYTFVLYFNKEADNAFQEASVNFDATLGTPITITEIETNGDGGNGGGGNGGGGGDGGGGATGGVTGQSFLARGAALGAVGGVETQATESGDSGQVEGDQTQPGTVEGSQVSLCRSWPQWVWIVLLIVYFAAFLRRTFSKLSEQVAKRKIRWSRQALLALAAFLIWYFGDLCREFQWFVISAIAGGAIVYLYYLYLYRKRLARENDKIKA